MIMLVALYGFLFGGAMSVPGGGNYMEFLMPGMFVMTMAFGIGETMASMAADAERGVTDRFRSMPMASSAVVVGRSMTDMIYATVGLAVMVGAGLVMGWRFHGEPGRDGGRHRAPAAPALRAAVDRHLPGPGRADGRRP